MRRDHHPMSLREERRGDASVLGIFLSLVAFAPFFGLVAAGGAIRHRASLNDAADSGAQAMAVMEAHAMNHTALLNQLKASEAGVVSALRAIKTAARTAQIVARICEEIGGYFAEYCYIQRLIANDILDAASDGLSKARPDVIFPAAEAAHQALRLQLPLLAQQAALDLLSDGYPEWRNGFSPALVTQGGSPLATTRGSASQSCRRVAGKSTAIVLNALKPFGPIFIELTTTIGLMVQPGACTGIGDAAPYIVQAAGGMGAQQFQIPFVAIGDPSTAPSDGYMRMIGFFNRSSRQEFEDARNILRRYAFAQAEYFTGTASGIRKAAEIRGSAPPAAQAPSGGYLSTPYGIAAFLQSSGLPSGGHLSTPYDIAALLQSSGLPSGGHLSTPNDIAAFLQASGLPKRMAGVEVAKAVQQAIVFDPKAFPLPMPKGSQGDDRTWTPQWQARLTRVTSFGGEAFTAGCERMGGGAACASAGSMLGELDPSRMVR